jgi:transketolase
MIQHSGACYLRLNRAGEPELHKTEFQFEIGKSVTVGRGSDMTFIATGPVLQMALAAAKALADQRISAAVLSMHTVKPLDAQAVRSAARATGCIISMEEHSARNGLGTAIADILAQSAPDVSSCLFQKLAVPDELIRDIGDQTYLRRHIGDPVGTAVSLMQTKRRSAQQTGQE